MLDTPKGMRRHIAVLGRRNAGKSTLLNALAGQDVAIVSPIPGTTTDPVEKTMEITGLGAVVLLDTAGMDDEGELGERRVDRSLAASRRADLAILVTDRETWGVTENQLAAKLVQRKIPFVVARNKMGSPPAGARETTQLWREQAGLSGNVPVVDISAKSGDGLEDLILLLKDLNASLEAEATSPLADLVSADNLIVLVAPQDSGAPKGRLILPQAQAIRGCLDAGALCLTATDTGYPGCLRRLATSPHLVVCDSQVVRHVVANTPANIPVTTFSILMARLKGDLTTLARGAAALASLMPGDTVMIQEACSHHPQDDDIGRVKIPALLKKMAGGDLKIVFAKGKEMSAYEPAIKAIVHCGACVITRRQMLERQAEAEASGCPITNYGMAISLAQGILPRVLELFPDALAAFEEARAN